MINLIIEGRPKPKERPRFYNGRVYTPQNTKNYEEYIRYCFINKYRGFTPLECELEAYIRVDMKIPKSASKKNRELMLKGKIRPIKKPDLDNIAKVCEDSLNGLAYKDDSQIVKLVIEKYYAEDDKVELEIKEVQCKN